MSTNPAAVEPTARPRLTLDEIELLKNALDWLPTKTVDECEAVSGLAARLESAALPLRRATGRWGT
jgi:hypothetical protein